MNSPTERYHTIVIGAGSMGSATCAVPERQVLG